MWRDITLLSLSNLSYSFSIYMPNCHMGIRKGQPPAEATHNLFVCLNRLGGVGTVVLFDIGVLDPLHFTFNSEVGEVFVVFP